MLRRFSVFSLAFLLCLSLFPARALADVGNASVLWSGSINDGAQFGAFVKGGTRYDAAAAALGYDSSRFSDEVKAKLSDSAYGGMFYTFANAFSSVSSPIEIPSWVPVFVTTSSVIADLLNNISGSNYPHWSVAVAYSVYDLALRDLLVVLSGGDVGGGGGSGGGVLDGNYTYYDLQVNTLYASNPSQFSSQTFVGYNATFNDNVLYLTGGTTNFGRVRGLSSYRDYGRVYVSDTTRAYFEQAAAGHDFMYAFDYPKPNQKQCRVMFTYGDNLSYELASVDGVQRYKFSGDNVYRYSTFVDCYYEPSGGYGFAIFPDVVPTFSSVVINDSEYFSSFFSINPPGGVWPDPVTPAAPVAPELPEPAEPVVETPVSPTVPAPVWPDITINIEPDPTPGTTPSGLDYTELLTRINDNLISIDSFARAINSNLNSLRSDLLAEFNGVIGSLRNIYNYLLTIDSVLETHCTHLRNKIEQSAVFIANYMRTLIKWLADQLDFDDLTNVEAPDNSLLTTINEKLGGGTYEPNPIKDEQGYYEWLDDLWDRFLLGDNWQSSMGSISGSFSELKTRFPFSVPWDIVALFRLFVHDPVTPVFDLPLYFSPDGSTPVHVDLSPWDSVASLVRPMVFVIFALKLALLSRDLLGGLGADKGGL